MIYEYECAGCGKVTEEITKIVAPKEQVMCTNCGEPAKRIFSAPRILLSTGSDETIGEYSGFRDRHEKMRMLGISSREVCGSLTKVKPHFSIQEERVSIGLEKEGLES